MLQPIKAYKLFRVRKDGTIGPLFINRSQVIPIGETLQAEAHPTKGFAFRPGWHCTLRPEAPHLKESLKSGEVRAWFEVEITGPTYYNRPESQGGTWVLAETLKVIRKVD